MPSEALANCIASRFLNFLYCKVSDRKKYAASLHPLRMGGRCIEPQQTSLRFQSSLSFRSRKVRRHQARRPPRRHFCYFQNATRVHSFARTSSTPHALAITVPAREPTSRTDTSPRRLAWKSSFSTVRVRTELIRRTIRIPERCCYPRGTTNFKGRFRFVSMVPSRTETLRWGSTTPSITFPCMGVLSSRQRVLSTCPSLQA